MLLKTVITMQHSSERISAVLYRIPVPVNKVLVLDNGTGFPICPRCDCTLEREYMNFCDRCGQKLGWDLFGLAIKIPAPRRK